MAEKRHQNEKNAQDQNKIKSTNIIEQARSGTIQDRLSRVCAHLGVAYNNKDSNNIRDNSNQKQNDADSYQIQNKSVHDTNQDTQCWQRCLGGSENDRAHFIEQTKDGGYIVAGWTESNDGDVSGKHGGTDAWVIKLDAAGRTLWQRCLGGFSKDEASCVHQTRDGGYIVTGKTRSNDGDVQGNHGLFDAWVVKLDADGAIEWQACLGGSLDDIAWCIQQTIDGGYIVAGETSSNDGDVKGKHGIRDAWIVKLNGQGKIEWQRCLGGSSEERAWCIIQTSDKGYMVAGEARSDDGDVKGKHGIIDAWIVKLNSNGEVEWQKCLGGSSEEIAKCIRQTLDGGYILAGQTKSNDGDVSGKHGIQDAWVVKLDSKGTIEWQRCLGGSLAEEAYCIDQTTDGGYIVAGRTNSNDGNVSGNRGGNDAWIVKLNFKGEIEWQKCLGGSGYDSARCIQQTTDGGYIVCGFTQSNDGDIQFSHGKADAWVVKLDREGIVEWKQKVDDLTDDSLVTEQPVQNQSKKIPIRRIDPDYPREAIIDDHLVEAAAYIKSQNYDAALRRLETVLKMDPDNGKAKALLQKLNGEDSNPMPAPVTDEASSPPKEVRPIPRHEFHRPYDIILEKVYPGYSVDQEGFRRYLYLLQEPLLSLIDKYRLRYTVDYNDSMIQTAYILRYYPFYIETIQRILNHIHDDLKIYSDNNPVTCCFYGPGPAPELLGLAAFLKQQCALSKDITTYFFDTGDWIDWRRVTIEHLLPQYNDRLTITGENHITMDIFDILQTDHPEALKGVRSADIHIMQNCCTDLLRREKNREYVTRTICNLFSATSNKSIFIITDVATLDIPLLFSDIVHMVTTVDMSGTVISDFDFSEQAYKPRFIINPTVKDILFDDKKIRSRTRTKYNTIVLQRV